VKTGDHNLLYFTGAFLLTLASFNALAQSGADPRESHDLRANQVEAPISFEPNLGQAEKKVKFVARGPGYTLSLTHQGVVLSFEQPESRAGSEAFHSLAVKFEGTNVLPKVAGQEELNTKSSYFMGADPAKWHTGIPNYARVTIESVYHGIDVMYRGTHGRLQCSFLVAPGAEPSRITMAISGANSPTLDSEGNLILRSGSTEVRLSKPATYQDAGPNRRLVGANYRVRHGRIAFVLTDYDSTKPLTIEAALNYEGYLTTEDEPTSIPARRLVP